MTNEQIVQQYYIAYYGRPADPAGLTFWTDRLAIGVPVSELIASFGSPEQTEFVAIYGEDPAAEDFLTAAYQNIYNRAPDDDGLAFWLAKYEELLDSGMSADSVRATLVIALVEGVADSAPWDKATFDNKTVLAEETTTLAEQLTDPADVGALIDFVKNGAFQDPEIGFPSHLEEALDGVQAEFNDLSGTTSGQTFTLTADVDSIPGLIGSLGTISNIGNDTIIAGEGSLGGVHTLGSSDVINGGDGIDRMNLRLADTSPAAVLGQSVTPNMTSVEQVYTQALNSVAGGVNSINAINTKGTTEWWSDRSTADLDINNVQDLATLGVIGGVVDNDYTVGFAPAVATTELNVALQGAVLNDLGASRQGGGTEFSTWNFNVSGTANSTIERLTDDAEIATRAALTDMTKLTASGDRMLTIEAELQNTTTIDASAQTATTAGLRVVVDDAFGKNITFTGGAGTDRVDVQDENLTQADKLDGGDGVDTFRIANGSQAGGMMTLVNAQNVKNFEIFEGMGANQTYNLDNLLPNNVLSEVHLNPDSGTDITVNNIPDTATGAIRVVADEINVATLTAKSFIQGGTSDAVTLILDNAVARAAGGVDGVDIAELNFSRLDNLNLQSLSDGSPSQINEQNSIGNLIAGDLEVITVTGDQSLYLATDWVSNAVTKVDASGMIGAATLSVDLSYDIHGEGAQIIGTANDDFIAGTSVNELAKGDNITAGAGSDTVVLGWSSVERNNTINYTATALSSGDVTADTADTVWNVGEGDRINFTAGIESQLKANGYVLSSVAAPQTLTNRADSAQFDINNNVIAVDKADGSLALQIDLNGDGLFTATQDFEILFGNRAGSTIQYDAVNDYFTFTNVVEPVATPIFTLTADAATADEGANGTWTLNLANAVAGQDYSVNLDTVLGGGATAADVGALAVTGGAGVTFAGNVVTFAAGTTTAQVTVPFLTDAITPELGETVQVALSNPTNGALTVTPTAPVEITDVPPGAQTTVDVTAGGAFTATAGVDIFVYNFDIAGGRATTQAAGAAATIAGFDATQDILRFNNTATATPSTEAAFLALAGVVPSENPFALPAPGSTAFFFDPNGGGIVGGVTLTGILDQGLVQINAEIV
ncbi:DUF4214 domain-containing protein [Thiocystis violacea]|uniref:DUF4214 domain-containing protein n=1 Tax=Thiocystis violacea TaxID=13725 RepID=UPI0019079386|nr:DUF4214 domain-containing protein [Thiocystis violacea]MBK1720085.1 hypothetical protein [Thiocystis violacea]